MKKNSDHILPTSTLTLAAGTGRYPSDSAPAGGGRRPALLLSGLSAACLLAAPLAEAVNTADNFTGGATASLSTTGNWSLNALPLVSNDAVFTTSSGGTGIRPLTATSLTVGSLDVSATSGIFTINNQTSGATGSTLTLGGAGDLGNSLASSTNDLIYVASGATLSLSGPNGSTGTGLLGITVGQAGNFDIAGTNIISANISSSSYAVTKTGSGLLTLSGTNTFSAFTLTAGTLQLQNPPAFPSAGLTVASGTTLQLRANSGATFAPSTYGFSGSGAVSYNFDVNNVTSGTGNTIILANVGQFGPGGSTDTFNLTGGNGYTLQLGSGSNGNGTLSVYNNTTLNANTAGVTLSIPGGIGINYNTTYSLTLGGAGNITIGALNRNNTNNLTPTFGGSGVITLTGANNFGAAAGTVTNTVTLALNNNGALTGLSTLALNGTVTLDNTSGGPVTISATPAQTWNSDFTFGTANTSGNLNLGTGTVVLPATRNLTLANSNYSLTVGGVVSGTNFGITKIGTGTLILTNINTYSGATTVNNGRLEGVAGGSSTNSAVTVQSSGTGASPALATLYTGGNAQWTCASLTTAAGTGNGPVLEFAFTTTPSTSVAPLKVIGTATFTATPTVKVDLGNLSGLSGTLPLLVVGGTAPTAVPTLTIVGGYSGSSLAWSGNTLNLTLAGSSTEPLKWATSTSGNWDNNDSTNTVWKNSGAVATYYQEPVGGSGDQVVFDNTYITANTAVALNTILNPTSVTVTNSTYNYTIAGPGAISGATSLTKTGSASLTLGNTNTYTGGTTVSAGTLQLGVANAVPGNTFAGDVTVNGTLDLNTYNEALNGLNGAGTVDTVAGGTPTLTVGANGDSGSFSGVIKNTTGTLTLTKSGSGTETFTGTNTYAGTTTVSGGKLQFTGAGASTGGGALVVSGGGVLTLNTSGQVQGSTLTFSGNTANTAVNLQSGVLTLTNSAGTISSGGTANTLTFNGGTLKSGNASGISIGGTLPIVIAAGGGTLDTTIGNITTASGFGYSGSTGTSAFTIQGGNIFSGQFTSGSGWTGPVMLTGTGTKWVQTGADSLSGALNLGAGTTFDMTNAAASFGGLTGAGTIINSSPSAVRTLTITGTGGNTFSGTIAPAATPADTAVTVNLSSGTQAFSGVNTYSGATTVVAGTLQLQNPNAIASSTLGYDSGSSLSLRSDTNATFVTTSVVASNNASAFTWNVDVNNINPGNTGKTLILANVNQLMGANAFTMSTLNVTGGNGYTLQMGANSAGTSAVNFWNNLTVNANTPGVTLAVPGGLSCNYGANYSLTLGGAGNLTIGAMTRSGSFSLTPALFGGSGTITLTGANNFGSAAGTVTNTGTLALNNNGAFTGLSSLAVNSPVTLDNTSGGTVTIATTPPETWNSDFTFGSTNTTGALNLGAGTVTLAATRSLTMANSTYGLTVGGGISGTNFGLNLTGPGSLTLTGVNTFSGNVNINSGTLTVGGAGQLGSGNFSANITNNSGLVYNSSAAQTLSGLVTGTGALTQKGAGTLILAPASGNDNYSGLTTVTGGRLVVQSTQTITNGISVADGADLGVVVSGSSQLSPNALTLGSASGATLDFSGINSTTAAPITAGTFAAGGTLTVTINSGTFVAGQTYPLITWISGSAPTATLSSMLTLGITGHLVTTSNTLNLAVDTVSDIWTGSTNGNWDAVTTGNWTGLHTIFADGDAVVFDDTAPGTTNVTVNQVVQPSGIVFNNSAKNYTLTSSAGKFIGGTVSLVKNGSGSLILSGGYNTNTGVFAINGGKVTVSTLANGGVASDLGASANSAANLTLNGTTLQYTGPSASSDRLFTMGTNGATLDASGTGAVQWSNPGPAGLSGSGPRTLTLTGTNTAANTLTAAIGDSGGSTAVTKTGTGTWTLGGSNTFSGTITLSSGMLALSGSGTLGNGSNTLTVSSGTLDLGGLTTPAVGAVNLTGGATLQNGSLTATNYSDTHTSGTVSVTAGLLGTAGLTVSGGATLNLSGTNAYTGVTLVSSGTVNLLNNQLGLSGGLWVTTNNSTAGTVNVGSATQTAPTWLAINSGSLVQLGASSPSGTAYGVINVNGTSSYATTATNNGTLWVGRQSQLNVNAYGNWVQNGNFTEESQGGYWANITVAANGAFVYAGTNPINLPVTGSSPDNLTINGTFTTAQGFSYNVTGSAFPVITLSGGTLALSANVSQLVTNAGTVAAGQFLLGSGGGVFNTAGYSTTLGLGLGNVASQTGSLSKTGLGTLTLTGTNTYTGSTTVNGGTLALAGKGSLASPNLILASNATLDVSGLSTPFTLGAAQVLTNTGSGALLAGNLNTGSGTLALLSVANPAFLVTNGTLTLSNTTTFTVKNTGAALAPGTYELIGTATGGALAGTLPSVTVTGGGIVSGASASLANTGSQLNLVVSTLPTTNTLVLLAGGNPSTYGGSLTFRATLSPAPANGETITFKDGLTTLGSGATVSGVATLTTSTLPAGPHSLTAVYGGDSTYSSSTSSAFAQTVNAAALTITASNTNEVYVYGAPAFSGGNGVTYAGFVNGETNTVLAGTLSYGGNSQGATNAGVYSIIPSGLTNAVNTNYNIAYGTGFLTISQATPVITLGSSVNPVGYLDSVSFSATLATNATGSVVFASTNGPISTNSLADGTATSLAITNLARGGQTITVVYSGDGNYLAGTNTFSQTVTNHPPATQVMTVTCPAGLSAEIALSDLATNWSDVDGDPVELTAINLTTTNGVPLFPINLTTNLDGSYVITNNAYLGFIPSSSMADQISYSISDGQGGTNIGYINLVIQSSVTGTNSITSITGGNPNGLTAYGVPGFSYITQRSTNLTTWVNIATNTAGTNGVINVSDSFSDLSGEAPSTAFYRLLWQP